MNEINMSNVSVYKPKKFNTGWRYFVCDECKYHWKVATRDCTSPSVETCPNCQESCSPSHSETDLSIPHDDMGNLT